LSSGRKRRRRRHLLQHLGLGLADADAADGVAREVERRERLGRLPPQVVEGRALRDREDMVARGEEPALRRDLLAALRPAKAARAGERAGVALDRPGRALVEHHRDVGAEVRLDAHHFLGPEEQLGAVEVGLERDAVVADLPQLREAEDLEAAAVRQDRAVPSHELVEPPSSRISSLVGRRFRW
jgi:hypothetical protein